jgi:hypothetical protein
MATKEYFRKKYYIAWSDRKKADEFLKMVENIKTRFGINKRDIAYNSVKLYYENLKNEK